MALKSIFGIAAVVICAAAVRGAEFKSAPVWDLAKDAGAVSEAFRKDGFVPLDPAHAFDVPHTAVKDSQAFTVEVKFSCDDDTQKRKMQLLSQKTPTTGWGLGFTLWGGVGSPIALQVNDAYFGSGWFRTKPGETHTMIVTARNGLAVVYWNGRLLKRFFTRITPNLEPIRVGPKPDDGKGVVRVMEGVKLLSLKFWDEGYFAPGESKEFAEGFRGGPGWLMSCPTEDPKVKLPRILCYGDSILGGYGPRLRKALEGKAYVYTWSSFQSHAVGEKMWRNPFDAACKVAEFDAVVFNNGLHSLDWTEDKVSDADLTATQRTIWKYFREGAPKAKIWWLATTPHTSKKKNAQGKVDATGELDGVVKRINRLTAEAMKKENTPIIDAYGLLLARLDLACGDGYHWHGAGSDLIVKKIIETLAPELGIEMEAKPAEKKPEAKKDAKPAGAKVEAKASRPGGVYGVGETVEFTASMAGEVEAGTRVMASINENGKWIENVTGKPGEALTVSRKLDAPGWVNVSFFLKAADGKLVMATDAKGRKQHVIEQIGAVVEPLKVKAGAEEPKDFDEYWRKEREKLAKVEAGTKFTEIEGRPGRYFMRASVGKEFAGVDAVVVYDRKAAEKTLPIHLFVHGAGVHAPNLGWSAPQPKESPMRGKPAIFCNLNAHGLPSDKPKEFYAEKNGGELKHYPFMGSETTDGYYMKGLVLRLMRCIDELCKLPQWDGKNVIVSGGSQGGAQALMAGGIDPRVSYVHADVPAMCDWGAQLAGHSPGWPKPYWVEGGKYTRGVDYDRKHNVADDATVVGRLGYFDAANFARRIKCAASLTCGGWDGVCPPTSVFAAYNAIPSANKKMLFSPLGGHCRGIYTDVERQSVAIWEGVKRVK